MPAGPPKRDEGIKHNRYDGSGKGGKDHNIHVMVIQRAEAAQPLAPAPRDQALSEVQSCVMDRNCLEAHLPLQCAMLKRLTPKARLELIREKHLCQMCFQHLDNEDCQVRDKVTGCKIDNCEAPHHPLLHEITGPDKPMKQGVTARPGG
jgi:hypothetical protein